MKETNAQRNKHTEVDLCAAIVSELKTEPGSAIYSWIDKLPCEIDTIATKNEVLSQALLLKSFLSKTFGSEREILPRQRVVAVAISEGLELCICQLGILLSQHIYVPIDTEDPRFEHIIADCQPHIVIQKSQQYSILKENNVVFFEDILQGTATISKTLRSSFLSGNTTINRKNEIISHIFYTSGTTGVPKGVVVSKSSLQNFVYAKTIRSKISRKSKVFLGSAFTFDPHYGDTIICMYSGATLCSARRELIVGGFLAQCMKSQKVTHICLTPSLWSIKGELAGRKIEDELIPECFPDLQELSLGGELMPNPLVQNAIRSWKSLRLVNTYGLTECTVYQTTFTISSSNEFLHPSKIVGTPYENVRMGLYFHECKIETIRSQPLIWTNEVQYLDCMVQSAIVNGSEEGEIIIGGMQVSCGYLNLASASFFQHNEIRCFATGDIGRFQRLGLKNFTIEFLGRNDNQVKIHGVRVELDEIEQVILSCPIIKSVVVVQYRESKIVAVVSFTPTFLHSKEVQSSESHVVALPECVEFVIQEFARRRLPHFMVPKRILSVTNEGYMQSRTGKKNRSILSNVDSLPFIQAIGSKVDLLSHEAAVASIWRSRLGKEGLHISPFDNFRSLGGDSLDAQRVTQDLLCLLSEGLPEEYEPVIRASKSYGESGMQTHVGLSPLELLESINLREYVARIIRVTPAAETALRKVVGSEGQGSREESSTSTERALLSACALGYIPVVKLLVDAESGLGVPPDAGIGRRNRRGKSPLHIAAACGNADVVKLLLQYGSNVFATTIDKILPIHIAAAGTKASSEIVRLISSRMKEEGIKFPFIVRDGRRQNVVHAAARGGNSATMQLILEELREGLSPAEFFSTICALDRWNRSPLHWAVVNNHTEVVKLLVENGANPEMKQMTKRSTYLPYETPVRIAQRKEAHEILKYFDEWNSRE